MWYSGKPNTNSSKFRWWSLHDLLYLFIPYSMDVCLGLKLAFVENGSLHQLVLKKLRFVELARMPLDYAYQPCRVRYIIDKERFHCVCDVAWFDVALYDLALYDLAFTSSSQSFFLALTHIPCLQRIFTSFSQQITFIGSYSNSISMRSSEICAYVLSSSSTRTWLSHRNSYCMVRYSIYFHRPSLSPMSVLSHHVMLPTSCLPGLTDAHIWKALTLADTYDKITQVHGLCMRCRYRTGCFCRSLHTLFLSSDIAHSQNKNDMIYVIV